MNHLDKERLINRLKNELDHWNKRIFYIGRADWTAQNGYFLTLKQEVLTVLLTWRNNLKPYESYIILLDRALLIQLYSTADRHYHNFIHIQECLAELEEIWNKKIKLDKNSYENSVRFAELDTAIWFHDAVYNPRSKYNEENSTILFKETQPTNTDYSNIVCNLIMLTKHENKITRELSLQEKLMIDIDLSILGSDIERYLEYEKGIRKEYSFVPGDIFVEKRMEILKNFQKRTTIYQSEYFIEKYEERARKNIQTALKLLAQ